jgi:hypothetical protein
LRILEVGGKGLQSGRQLEVVGEETRDADGGLPVDGLLEVEINREGFALIGLGCENQVLRARETFYL